jgi:hypothetical protein
MHAAAAEYANWFEDCPIAGVFTMMLIVAGARYVNKVIGGLMRPRDNIVEYVEATTNTEKVETADVSTIVDMEALYKETAKYFGRHREEELLAFEGMMLVILDGNVYRYMPRMGETGRLQKQRNYWLQGDAKNYRNCFRNLIQSEVGAIGSLVNRQAWDRLIDRVATQYNGGLENGGE